MIEKVKSQGINFQTLSIVEKLKNPAACLCEMKSNLYSRPCNSHHHRLLFLRRGSLSKHICSNKYVQLRVITLTTVTTATALLSV